MWASVADTFVGPDPARAIDVLRELQAEMDAGYRRLFTEGRRKIDARDAASGSALFTVCVVDEIAYYSATAGDKKTQETFSGLLRDLVARGRAVGVIVVAATQRPSADIIPTSLRDLFGFRCAFRTTTDSSSDIILGTGWAKQGFSSKDIPAEDIGIGWLLAEGGKPRRFKAAFLTDQHVDAFTAHATRTAQTAQTRSRGGYW
jgi:S-DNA-T family DNA segregation ATPase FtsK/SpoIIIE